MKKMLIVMFMMGLVASGAWAYPGPDSYGVYIDTAVTGNPATCADFTLFVQDTLYVCITNPSGPQVRGWEARVHLTNSAAFFGNWVLTSGLNVGSGEEFIVGNGLEPLLPNAQGAVVLMSMTMVVVNDTEPIEIFIDGVPGSTSFPNGPGYAAVVGFPTPCVTSTGGPTIPVFRVNGLCEVADEHSSWGALKTLYR